ncbi:MULTISPECIES: LamG-like jellyroll fold domain-containing protein [unclassified Streptomyces]|uniref:LamG-like jellyroll fold domain-containing protein n=1 Tax=unclassified Streptomyces TaxID=2593676 RepID=UPI000B89D6A1|nr:LamG-like jellyroll fold domain-containing protein [Streptomyces sp. DvalAA-14]MYS25064.1 hypothetical protein [Streptomyces sp. SID4948]
MAQAVPAHGAGSASTSQVSQARAQTDAEASVKAQATGDAVPIPADTTPTETLTANPDGSFTLDQSVEPVRKRIGGAWKPLDPSLIRNSDGSVSPSVTSSALTLSGGGSGALAVMKTGSRSLDLTLPVNLPTPSLSGSTATYADVIPGVDLKVMADNQGGFSDVLVVKTAAAASSPDLGKLTTLATRTNGVTVATDTAGNITADDPTGATVFAAPAPLMWDSAVSHAAPAKSGAKKTKAGGTADPTGSSPSDGGSGDPVTSSPTGPGIGAHTAAVDSDYSDGTITLTPDPSLLTASSTMFPVYIDPSYTAGGGVLQAWTYVNSYYSGTSFWKTTDAVGLRVGRQGWESPNYTARTFAQLSVDSRLKDAVIKDSHFYATETYSASCTAEPVELWTTGGISSATTWDHQPSWNTKLATVNAAHGWSSDCPTDSIGFDTSSEMTYIAGHLASSITLGLKASDESDPLAWKKFDHATMSMSTTFNHAPSIPSSPHTSPTTTCTGSVTVIGNGDVSLYAKVADPDGGALKVSYQAWKTGTGTTIQAGTLSATSGTVAPPLIMKKATLDAAAANAVMAVSWNVSVSDGSLSSKSASTTCRFNFDPTIPGAPDITDSTGADCGDSTSAAAYTVGTAAGFTIHPTTGSTPSSYLYQVNGGAPQTTTKTTFSVKPSRGTDILTVTARSAGGNIGDTAVCIITAAAPATAPDGDLNGDGIADLLTVGHQDGLPAGLWLSPGQAGAGHTQGDGQILTTAANIGNAGTGMDTRGTASDYNGTQAITGHFATGAGFNDVLDYDRATGSGTILFGSGDGSALSPVSGSQVNVDSGVFTDSATGVHATQIASAGNLFGTANGAGPDGISGFPDLLLTVEGHLYLEPSVPTPGGYVDLDNSSDISDTNPTGSGDWTGWTITTSLVGGLPAMFARADNGGGAYYYRPADLENLAIGNPAVPVQAATSWYSAAQMPLLQAADINTDGTPDIWTTDPTGNASSHYFDGTAFSSISTQQKVIADTHNWILDDAVNGNATTAADNATTPLSLAGAGTGPRWDDGDLFDPHLHLDGTGSAMMIANAALTPSQSFSVSVWAKPAALGGVVLSQDGTSTSGFLVYTDASTNTWNFCMARADTTTTARDCAAGGAVHLNAWSHVTATYNATTKRMALYVDGIEANEGSHTPVTGFLGHFTVGRQLYQGTYQSYFNGNLADAEVWAGTTLSPDQVAVLSGTPGYVLFPSDDTNYASGLSWTTAGAKMTFTTGQLAITETASCTANCTWTVGSTGHPGAVLTLQSDNNLVIYSGAAHTLGTSLWAAGTNSALGSTTLFLQPDGNLVLYDADGTVLWYSSTLN